MKEIEIIFGHRSHLGGSAPARRPIQKARNPQKARVGMTCQESTRFLVEKAPTLSRRAPYIAASLDCGQAIQYVLIKSKSQQIYATSYKHQTKIQ